MTKRNTKVDETLIDITEVKHSAESFLESNQKYIIWAAGALLVLAGGYFAYKYFWIGNRQEEALTQMFQAESQFEKDSFSLALTNPGGGYKGFVKIIDDYSGTPAANAAKYYAGVSYLNLGQFDNAIKYLEDYSPDGDVLPIMKYGALGDAYSEKNDFKKALDLYEKAVGEGDNEVLTAYYLKKIGMLNEKQGNAAAAKEAYLKIKKEYPNSTDARDIDKFIARAEAKGK